MRPRWALHAGRPCRPGGRRTARPRRPARPGSADAQADRPTRPIEPVRPVVLLGVAELDDRGADVDTGPEDVGSAQPQAQQPTAPQHLAADGVGVRGDQHRLREDESDPAARQAPAAGGQQEQRGAVDVAPGRGTEAFHQPGGEGRGAGGPPAELAQEGWVADDHTGPGRIRLGPARVVQSARRPPPRAAPRPAARRPDRDPGRATPTTPGRGGPRPRRPGRCRCRAGGGARSSPGTSGPPPRSSASSRPSARRPRAGTRHRPPPGRRRGRPLPRRRAPHRAAAAPRAAE